MTGPDDEITAALARTLRHHAEEAPSVDGLPEKAVVLVARRRRCRINASIAAIVVLVVSIPVTSAAMVDRGLPQAASQADPTWRWESYQDVQVQVPPDWTYGVPGSSWCAAPPEGETRHVRPGAVGRPAPSLTIKCPSDYPPANEREHWLTFNSRNKAGVRFFDHGWVEETRRVRGVFVTVFTNDEALRTAILGSAQPVVGADRYGCPSDHPIAVHPDGYRPAKGGLPPATAVESVSVCRYTLAADSAPPLLSSARITGAEAKGVVDAILSAPEGEGPDVENASPGDHGTEIVVLRVDTADGTREVVVRYAGDSHNGFDDGTTKHKLTAAAIRPLLTGANSPTQMFLPVAELLPD